MWTLIEISECVVEEYRHRQQLRRSGWPGGGVLTDEIKRAVISVAISLIAKKILT